MFEIFLKRAVRGTTKNRILAFFAMLLDDFVFSREKICFSTKVLAYKALYKELFLKNYIKNSLIDNEYKIVTLHSDEILYFPKNTLDKSINHLAWEFNDLCNGHNYFSLLDKAERERERERERFKGNKYSCVCDIGAGEGLFGLRMAEKGSEVHFFEPNKTMCNCIERMIKNTKCNYKIHNIALNSSNKMQIAPFYVDKEEPLSSKQDLKIHLSCHDYPKNDYFVAPNNKSLKMVKYISLDKFINDKKIITFDLIKMDIEGGEMEALKGMSSLITKSHPDFLVCLYHQHEDIFTIPAFFIDYGYKLFFGNLARRFLGNKPNFRPMLVYATYKN